MEKNNDKEIDLVGLISKVWHGRRKIIKWAIGGALLGLIIAISIPKEYTSIVKIAPESQNKNSSGSAGALASMMGIGGGASYEGINEKVYPEILSSTPFLMEFADIEVQYDGQTMPLSDYILNHRKRVWWSYVTGFPGQVIGWFSSAGPQGDSITIKNSPAMQYAFSGALDLGIDTEIEEKLGIITITSTFQNLAITKTISDSLVTKLQRYMSNYRTAKTRSTLITMTESLAEAKARYYCADEAYARALDSNHNLISRSAEIAISRLRNERELTFQIYSQLAQQVESTRIKLQEETPVATIIEPATTPTGPSAPKKMMIIIVWTFIAGFIAAGGIVIKKLLEK